MTGFNRIKVGMTNDLDVTVDEDLLVSHIDLPVLSTPNMVKLMERVCFELVQPLLPSGFTTVGYEVSIKHKAPARMGARLKVWGKILEADGRRLLFEVRVTEGDKVIGEGIHRRTAIPLAR